MAADYIVSPLTQIINSFISNDIFPADLENGKSVSNT